MINGNLHSAIPAPGTPQEEFTDLFRTPQMRIERIVSHGHHSPPDFWYDQEETEWVLLLEGEATMEFKDAAEIRKLKRGDWLLIPAHKKHRVLDTSSPAIWLAVWERKN